MALFGVIVVKALTFPVSKACGNREDIAVPLMGKPNEVPRMRTMKVAPDAKFRPCALAMLMLHLEDLVINNASPLLRIMVVILFNL